MLNCCALLQQSRRPVTLSTSLSPLLSAVSLLNVCTFLEAGLVDLIYFHCECTHTQSCRLMVMRFCTCKLSFQTNHFCREHLHHNLHMHDVSEHSSDPQRTELVFGLSFSWTVTNTNGTIIAPWRCVGVPFIHVDSQVSIRTLHIDTWDRIAGRYDFKNSQGALYPLSILVVSLFAVASRDSLVSLVTGLLARHPWFQSNWDKSFHNLRTGCGAHLASSGYRGLLPRGKAVGAWGYHSSPSTSEIKNKWSCTSLPLCAFMECMGQTLRF